MMDKIRDMDQSIILSNDPVLPASKLPKRVRHTRRVITEQRRAQNRIAQKIHREKQKRKLQELTSIVGPQNLTTRPKLLPSGKDCRVNDTSEEFNGCERDIAIPSNTNDDTSDGFRVSEHTDQFSPVQAPVSLQTTAADHTGSLWDNSLYVFNVEDFTATSRSLLSESLGTTEDYVGSCSVPAFDDTSRGQMLPLSSQEMVPIPHKLNLMTTFRSSSLAPKQLLSRDELEDQRIAKHNDVDELRTFLPNKGITLGDIIEAGIKSYSSGQTSILPSSLLLPDLSYLPSSASYSYLADPRKNHIRLSAYCLTAACLANLTHIGVIHAFACHQMASPFYDPTWTPSMFTHLKPDLRPCASQISQPHPLYIDALPFPSLREKIIALRAVEPKIFNENELWDDMANGGVVCWGGGTGGKAGNPWDGRSWEVRAWFLRKWWMLTGGLEGELGRQSRWWCEIKGEGLDDFQ